VSRIDAEAANGSARIAASTATSAIGLANGRPSWAIREALGTPPAFQIIGCRAGYPAQLER
jgi:hypothetical protein